MAMRKHTPIKTVPFRGGAITVRDKALLPFGAFSEAQNIRPKRPGFIKRPGQRKLHSDPDGTNKVLSLYQFRKSEVDENHFYAQFSDGDVLEATNTPPTVTADVFGGEAYSGGASQRPAAWSVTNDQLIHSNGVDQHQIYGGDSSYVDKFIVYKGSGAPADVPQVGEDYSLQVSDGRDTTVAVLDSLNTYANNECFYIRTPVPVKSFTFTMAKPNTAGANCEMDIYYRKNDNTWSQATITDDGTLLNSKTLGKNGTIVINEPTDLTSKYQYGSNGFWYQFRIATAALDGEVEISSVTWDSSWQSVRNVWDGVSQDPIEVWVEGSTQWKVYSAGAVDLDALTGGKKTLLFCTDPIEGIYIDVGNTPNATGDSLTSIKYWDGNSFESVGSTTDETSGMSNSGWVTFPRKAAQPTQFETSLYYSYVYEIIWSGALADDTEVAFQVMPYFDIDELGNSYTSCVWKNHMGYTFDQYGSYIYMSAENLPQVLNGDGYGILQAGDGRTNKVVGQRRFHNELMVWQEEKGVEGGCVTLFEGYSPTTYGKLVLSSSVGGMNSKAVDVVDGVTMSTATDEQIKTMAFFLSRRGVFGTDGRVVFDVTGDIGNYFDPTLAECVTRGKEAEMWLSYDSAYDVIRIGLVSGTGGTVPNIFPVLDLKDMVWYFDTLGQGLSCAEEVEGASGDVTVIQVGGGIADGTVYQLNYGQNDVSTAVDTAITLELNGAGEYILLSELVLRCKVQTAGNISLTIKANDVTKVNAKALSMITEVAGQAIRRHRMNLNIQDQHISIRLRHNTVSQDMYLYDIGVRTELWDRR